MENLPPLLQHLADIPRLHTVPFPELRIGKGEITLSVDDVDEKRFQLVFKPFQAIRVTTVDCFLFPTKSGFIRGGVFIVENSPWVLELREALRQIDRTATFMDKAFHYLIPAGDDVIEVVAWGVVSSRIF
ncbi:MAG: hypothetical protein IPH04_17445 [Saprospirales bacterium]|nr:hypothetical protein [Saprospirales bacterium]